MSIPLLLFLPIPRETILLETIDTNSSLGTNAIKNFTTPKWNSGIYLKTSLGLFH